MLISCFRNRPADLFQFFTIAITSFGACGLALACTSIVLVGFGLEDFNGGCWSVLSLANPDSAIAMLLVAGSTPIMRGSSLLEATLMGLFEGLNKDLLLLAGEVSRVYQLLLLQVSYWFVRLLCKGALLRAIDFGLVLGCGRLVV